MKGEPLNDSIRQTTTYFVEQSGTVTGNIAEIFTREEHTSTILLMRTSLRGNSEYFNRHAKRDVEKRGTDAEDFQNTLKRVWLSSRTSKNVFRTLWNILLKLR